LRRIAGIALIAIAAVRIVSTYHVFNQTWDEPCSVACGIQWLDNGTYDLDPKHPPLGRVAAAAGLYLMGARSPGFGYPYVEGNALLLTGNYWTNLTVARLGSLPFFLLACAVVWMWTSWAFGSSAGLLAVGLFSFLPPVLGHAGMAMTDITLAATLPAALFSFCIWLERPTLGRTLAFGACVGLAVLSKFTTFVFLPLCGLPLAITYWRSTGRMSPSIAPRVWLLRIGLASLTSAVVIWAGYRFSWGTIPALGTRLHLPAAPLIRGLHQLWLHNQEGHWNVLFGRRSNTGWWYFYPVLLAVKTPAAFLLLAGLGIASIVRRAANWRARTLVWPIAGILAAGLPSHVNTGIRHILPIYVMFAGAAAAGLLWTLRRSRAWAVAGIVLLVWYTASSAWAHPDYLAYFNEFAPGEAGAFGVDSDLDWGQDLARMPEVCARHHVDSLALAYNGSADLDRFGLPPWHELSPGVAETGWIGISIYKLKLGTEDQPDAFRWLERFQPVDRAGKSILLYFIPPAQGQ
jgi:4-amino-4-deoxy-L-arabinose transferase-like glycosyltransferase